MGFQCAATHFSSASRRVQFTFDILLDNVNCDEGVTEFGDCQYMTSTNCDHAEDIFLLCSQATNCGEMNENPISFSLAKADVDKHHLLQVSRTWADTSYVSFCNMYSSRSNIANNAVPVLFGILNINKPSLLANQLLEN
eukprot:sb/3474404/